jgi:recombination protein RecT
MDSPVPVRRSATVLIVRPAVVDHGPSVEVLLLLRNGRSGFVPGATLYPGGAIDDDDVRIPMLPGRAGTPDSFSLAIAAVARETYEEAGIVLAVNEAGEFGQPHVMAADLSFADALGAAGLAVPTEKFVPWGRWVTPIGAPRRYDTLFFLVEAPAGAMVNVDGREIVDAGWWRPHLALEAETAGQLRFVTPTRKTLQRLAGCQSVSDALQWTAG